MTLRARILLSLAPPGLLLVALGAAGFLLLERMGGRIDAILRENYASVQAMFRLNEATERIDSSFQFALAGREADAARQFESNWKSFDEQFETEAAIPDWASEPDDEMFNYVDDSPMVDADGNPIYQPGQQPMDPLPPGTPAPRPGDQQWIDDVLNRPAPPPVQPGQQPQPGQPLPPPQGQPVPQGNRDPLAPRSGQPNAPQVSGQPAQR